MRLHYEVRGEDLDLAGRASADLKKVLTRLGLAPDCIRRTAIAMYEGEMNLVIHAKGGVVDVEINEAEICLKLTDNGPGIADIGLAMSEGFSTAPAWIREQGFGAGMGLPNMQRNADRFHIESEIGRGTVIELAVSVRGARE